MSILNRLHDYAINYYLSGISWSKYEQEFMIKRDFAAISGVYKNELNYLKARCDSIKETLTLSKQSDLTPASNIKTIIENNASLIEDALKKRQQNLDEVLNIKLEDFRAQITEMAQTIDEYYTIVKDPNLLLMFGFSGNQIADEIDNCARIMQGFILLDTNNQLEPIYDEIKRPKNAVGVWQYAIIILVMAVVLVVVVGFFWQEQFKFATLKNKAFDYCEDYKKTGDTRSKEICESVLTNISPKAAEVATVSLVNNIFYYGAIGLGIYLVIRNGPEIVNYVEETYQNLTTEKT